MKQQQAVADRETHVPIGFSLVYLPVLSGSLGCGWVYCHENTGHLISKDEASVSAVGGRTLSFLYCRRFRE